MKIHVKMDEADIRQAIADYVEKSTGVTIGTNDVKVEVKSKQNYRSEWEEAAIRCDFEAARRAH